MHFPLLSGTLNTVIAIIIAYCLSYYNGTITDKALEITQNELEKNTELTQTLERKVEERTIELSDSNKRLKQEIEERKQAEEALMDSERRFRELSIVDELTSLYNSRHFYSQLKIELERSNRYNQPLTILLLDLDDFKVLNDTYGHIEGDKVLRRLGQVIKKCLRKTDSAYRYGGEEFTILLPMTISVNGVVIAERIRTEFNNETFCPEPGQDIHLTVSIGIAQYKSQEDMKAFVNRVDQVMYRAKKNGKDRVCLEA
jgi:diguanylate cyclase (GGDEF)-like protein